MSKVALVTGSSSGIGRGAALALAVDGWDIVVHGRDKEKAEKTASMVREMGRDAYICCADLRDISEIDRLVEESVQHYGHIDALICNAGKGGYARFLDVTDEFLQDMFNNNMRSYFFVCQKVAKHMISKGIKGSIVVTTSVQQEVCLPEASVYGSLKAMAGKLVKHMALELAPYGIRVNAIGPGTIKVNDNPITEREKQLSGRTPITRLGYPSDTGTAFVFLADNEKSSFVTGAFLMVDGGQSLPTLCDNTFVERVPAPLVL